MHRGEQFANFYNHDFIRVAVAIPEVRVADPAFNARKIIELIWQAEDAHAIFVLFPELGISAYSCDDLFHQRALLDASLDALRQIVDVSRPCSLIAIVGAPLEIDHLLYNCAVVIYQGRILGVIPKTYLPNYREFYEHRYFAPADAAGRDEIELIEQQGIPFGNRLMFRTEERPLFAFHVEICEDLWTPLSPSTDAALAGATVLFNLSGSNVTIGKADYRRQLVAGQSARCLAAYVYASAGAGESTTDLAWDGDAMIYESGNLLAESRRFCYESQLICSEIDLERLSQERMRQTSFAQTAIREHARLAGFRTIHLSLKLPRQGYLLPERIYERFPYVPSEAGHRGERCSEVYQIQVQGLVKRLESTGIRRPVIGISGGLDSTQALLISSQAMDILGYPRSNIIGCTMRGYATSERTLEQARRLMNIIGCEAREIDIRPSCAQMFQDIDHPYAKGSDVFDVTFENVQAGERTSHLFRLANLHNGLVVGTSDLSELALGWCTYGVGDQMSHYGVNVSMPKTLVAHVIRWIAAKEIYGKDTSAVLHSILNSASSPELIPGQETESTIGPFELHDFFLYYTLRFGYSPTKVAFLCYCAWRDAASGQWPDIPIEKRRHYEIGEIKSYLGVFLTRFFKQSQFKRSCIPNGPKVGSGGSLSPRGDYRAPSDSEATVWLEQIEWIPNKCDVRI